MRKPLILSLGFHLALFTSLFVHFNFAQNNVGTHEEIMAYMYQQQSFARHQEKSSPLPIKEQAQKNDGGQFRAAAGFVNHPAQQTLGEPNELLTLLHNMIEAQINQTNFFNRKQKIYVAFILFPDGHIANVHLLESGASAHLNLAVIKAINAIQPVAAARNFLSIPHELKIQIVFGNII